MKHGWFLLQILSTLIKLTLKGVNVTDTIVQTDRSQTIFKVISKNTPSGHRVVETSMSGTALQGPPAQ